MSDVQSLDGKFWEFTADLAKGDTAYTNIALGAHTDNTYFVRRYTTDYVLCLLKQHIGHFRRIPPDCNSFIFSHTRTVQEALRS